MDSKQYQETILKDHPLSYWKLNDKEGKIIKDSSKSNFHGRITANANEISTKKLLQFQAKSLIKNDSLNKSIRFHPFGEFIDIGRPVFQTSSPMHPYSYEAWIKIEAIDKRAYYSPIISQLSGIKQTRATPDFSLYYNGKTGKAIHHRDNRFANNIYSDTLIKEGEIYHIVISIQSIGGGGKLESTMFINGNKQIKQGREMTIPMGDDNTRIGSFGKWGFSMSGIIDEVAIYGYALSEEQVLDHYQASFRKPHFSREKTIGNIQISICKHKRKNDPTLLVSQANKIQETKDKGVVMIGGIPISSSIFFDKNIQQYQTLEVIEVITDNITKNNSTFLLDGNRISATKHKNNYYCNIVKNNLGENPQSIIMHWGTPMGLGRENDLLINIIDSINIGDLTIEQFFSKKNLLEIQIGGIPLKVAKVSNKNYLLVIPLYVEET